MGRFSKQSPPPGRLNKRSLKEFAQKVLDCSNPDIDAKLGRRARTHNQGFSPVHLGLFRISVAESSLAAANIMPSYPGFVLPDVVLRKVPFAGLWSTLRDPLILNKYPNQYHSYNHVFFFWYWSKPAYSHPERGKPPSD